MKEKKEKTYDPHAHSYKGIDSREDRLKDIKTDRGDFRIKNNRKED